VETNIDIEKLHAGIDLSSVASSLKTISLNYCKLESVDFSGIYDNEIDFLSLRFVWNVFNFVCVSLGCAL